MRNALIKQLRLIGIDNIKLDTAVRGLPLGNVFDIVIYDKRIVVSMSDIDVKIRNILASRMFTHIVADKQSVITGRTLKYIQEAGIIHEWLLSGGK